MKKKLAIGAVILALIAGVAFWAIRGEDIKEKAVEKARDRGGDRGRGRYLRSR